MSIQEQVAGILREVKPGRNWTDMDDIAEGGYLDSFELMLLITRLSDTFGVEIPFEDIVPENFRSVAAIAAMVEKQKK